MATRGIGFLGWNTRFRGFESSFLLDHALVDIGVGVRWLREVQGVETVVLLGNSGGGSLMAAYQAQAVDPHVTPLEGMRPAAGLDDLPAGRRLHRQRRTSRPSRRADRLDGRVGRRRKRRGRHRSRARPVRRAQRSAVLRRLRRPVPRGTGRPQQRDHRLGRSRTQAGARRRLLRPAVHRDANLGRPAHGRSRPWSRPSARRTCATPACR